MGTKKKTAKKSDVASEPVGYGKPPKGSQFQKGRSGNPSGRPKKDKVFKSMERLLRECLLGEIVVAVNGRQHTMSRMEAIATKQVQLAMQGDHRSAKLILQMGEKYIPRKL